MRITFLLTRRVPDVPSPILVRVASLLRDEGHEVDGWIPEDRLLRTDTPPAQLSDLYLLKSHTEGALSYASGLDASGATILNPLRACITAQDKVSASRVMHLARIPTPATFLVATPAAAAPLLESGALIIKPNRGHRGAHVHVVRDQAELDRVQIPDGPLIAQHHVPGPGTDLKVYVAGDGVFAVRKPFDDTSFTRPGEPVPVSAEVQRIAMAAREAFELELFGLDIIESPDGPVVVDVNYFPGYKGCRDPEPAIAAVIAESARRVHL